MSLFLTILIINVASSLLSIIYKKRFFLSILICLEIILLNMVIFNFIISVLKGDPSFLLFSLFLIALAAVETSIGISIIALISRNFSSNSISALNLLKN